MTKKKKQILIIGIVLLVLVAALVVLLVTGKDDEDPIDISSVEDDSSVMLIDKDVKDLKSLEITTSVGSYELIQTGEKENTDSDTTYTYEIEEYKGLPVGEDELNTAAKTSVKLIANDIIEENSERLAEFGLDNPASVVHQTYFDGTEISYSIGNATPSGDQYYVCMGDETTVYEVAKTYVESYLKDKTVYIDCTILPSVESYPQIDEITISRSDLKKPIKIVPQTDADWAMYNSKDTSLSSSFSQYKMISPAKASLDIADQGSMMFAMWGMSATSAVKGYPSETEIKACGFDNPQCTVEVIVDGKSTKLIFGNKIDITDEDGNTFRYGMLEGRNVIYTFKESEVYWLTCQPEDAMTRMLTSPYIYNVSYITINYGGKDYTFNINVDSENVDNSTFEYEGNQLDADNFKLFYQYLHQSMIQSVNYDSVNLNSALTIEYGFNDASLNPIKVAFYPTETRSVYVAENGSINFVTSASYYERLIDNLQKVISGDGVKLSW